PDFMIYHFLEPCSFAEYGVLRCLFGVNTGQKFSDLLSVSQSYYSRIPRSFLPIGDDYLGNLICLCVSGENYGKIYHWNYEQELHAGYENDSVRSNMCLIGESFSSFIDALFPFGTTDHSEENWKSLGTAERRGCYEGNCYDLITAVRAIKKEFPGFEIPED